MGSTYMNSAKTAIPKGFILLINQKSVEQSGFVVIINFVKIFIWGGSI